ncbi:MAG: SRPBCC family protein [Nitriliruptorales bacterium]
MKITHEFDVERPPDAVWDFLQDIPQVASCMPGAELTEDKGDGVYAGKVSVKLGAMNATFEGEATVRPNPETRRCVISGRGADRRGGSRGQVEIEYALADAGAGTHVTVDADVKLSGAAAQFGRQGIIAEMSNRLIREFAECLEGKLGATTPEEAAAIRAGEVRGFPLFFASLWSSIVKFLRRTFGGRRNDQS